MKHYKILFCFLMTLFITTSTSFGETVSYKDGKIKEIRDYFAK